MKNVAGESSLRLVTLAALVMGLDYSVILFFPGSTLLSLNRFVFLGILVYDFLNHPAKYTRATFVYTLCIVILYACLPFLAFVKQGVTGPVGAWNELAGLVGTFTFLLFFYVNCRDTRSAGRIVAVLFFTSVVMAGYILGAYFGVTGEVLHSSRGGVSYTRASGAFDPNIITIYMIPCFAFGPLLALHSDAFAGFWKGAALVALICLCLFAVLQLNSRSGMLLMGASLSLSMIFRALLVPDRKRSSRVYSVPFVGLIVLVPAFLQWKYGIFDTVIAIFGVTHLSTDTSFAVRLASYRYLFGELLTGPNLWGDTCAYSHFWETTGFDHFNPHCSLLDIYVKGGLIYLAVYAFVLSSSMFRCLRGLLRGKDVRQRAILAGMLAYLVGFLPIMMTLSIETFKMPWGICGCVLGLAAHAARLPAAAESRPCGGKALLSCPR